MKDLTIKLFIRSGYDPKIERSLGNDFGTEMSVLFYLSGLLVFVKLYCGFLRKIIINK